MRELQNRFSIVARNSYSEHILFHDTKKQNKKRQIEQFHLTAK